MRTIVFDKEFRDSARAASWPFSPESTMLAGGTVLSNACFLDAVMYPIEAKAPMHISALDGTDEAGLRIEISDSVLNQVCSGVLDLESGKVWLEDLAGAICGMLLLDTVEASRLYGMVGLSRLELDQGDLELACGACFSPAATGARFVESAGELITGDVAVCAINGVSFEKEANGSVSVNLYGEMDTVKRPIKSVNGVEVDRMWLAAWPAGAIRVATDGERLTIGLEKDFGYGTEESHKRDYIPFHTKIFLG